MRISYQERSHMERLSAILDTHGRVDWSPVMSTFDDVTVFKKTSFSNCSALKSIFEWLRFSVIVFRVVVWTIAVSGAKQLRFQTKTD